MTLIPSPVVAVSPRSVVEPAVPTPAEQSAGAGRLALRLAGIWLALVALAVLAVGLAVVALAAEYVQALMAAVLVGATGIVILIARASWRAATPGRPFARAATFALGATALSACLVPAVGVLMPPGGLYGLDVYALWSGARLPWSIPILVPAGLMVFGTVSLWCAAGDPAVARRRTRVVTAALLATVLPIAALAAVDAAQPACGGGRTCVPGASVSFELPRGWSRVAPEGSQLYAARAGSDETRLVIEDGASIVRDAGRAVPVETDGLAALLPSLIADGPELSFSHRTGVESGRTVLPVGPAVRVAYVSATSFILTYYQTTVSYWFFADARLVVVSYLHAYGEGTPSEAGGDPTDFVRLLESVKEL